ncbi:MAG: penicillin-binding protein 1C [Saprospiraceae bacterium]|nr:penicillin-binding protein 1C [Saprospiraceae bacterium]
MKRSCKKWLVGFLSFFFVFCLLAYFSAGRLFKDIPYSPVLYSHEGEILSAKVASDGQWRLYSEAALPEKLVQTLICYEDAYFYYHFGVNPISLLRAIYQNLKAGRIVSGGSTITMQLAKIGLNNKRRSLFHKLNECIVAVGLEMIYSKNEILNLYTNLQPFGSNIVGVEAALWRYFGKKKIEITWAEAALLAVVPNQPNIIFQKEKSNRLILKRDQLLNKLLSKKKIDSLTYELSLLEEIPAGTMKFKRKAPHALESLIAKHPGQYNFFSSIQSDLQSKVDEIIVQQHDQLRQKDIHNMAVLVIQNQNARIISYSGNVNRKDLAVPQSEVDMIQASRSSGSTLKPFLVASMLDQGMIAPQSWVPDIPILLGGFRPENFNRNYAGLVTVGEVIHKSLNVPSVCLLKEYGVNLFYRDLKKLGFQTLFRPWEDYGLSLILGGAEIRPYELARAYAFLAFTLQYYRENSAAYFPFSKYNPSLLMNPISDHAIPLKLPEIFSAAAIWWMYATMRKDLESEELHQIAFKTGTSFGYKDAWCIGVTPNYTVCAWVGNSSGQARPDLIGTQIATPLVKEVYRVLGPSGDWSCPYDDLKKFQICAVSGYAPGAYCETVDTVFLPKAASALRSCNYHQQVWLSEDGTYRADRNCAFNLVSENYLVLPPVIEYFYKQQNPSFVSLPPWHPDCSQHQNQSSDDLAFIYPNENSSMVAPLDLNGDQNKFLFKATHKNPDMELHWFLDQQYLATTKEVHQLQFFPSAGYHVLTIMDAMGKESSVKIKVLD